MAEPKVVGLFENYTLDILRVNPDIIIDRLEEIKEDLILEQQEVRRKYYKDIVQHFYEQVRTEKDVYKIVTAVLNEKNIKDLNAMLDAIDDLDDNVDDIDQEIQAIRDGYAKWYNEDTGRINKIKY